MLNEKRCRYFSVHNDGTSSPKTNDEKELSLMKLTPEVNVKFRTMSPEEPENTDVVGLKKAHDNSFQKLILEIEISNAMVGMCTDRESVNIAMYKLVKQDMGDHLLLTLCPAHKLELAIENAFSLSNVNKLCAETYKTVLYFFRRSDLRWRLFKRQATFDGKTPIRYKRPE